MEKEIIKRKNYVIDKSFQFRFIATFLTIVVLSLVIFSILFAGFYWLRYMAGDNVFSEFITVSRQVPMLDENNNPKKDKDGNTLTTTKEDVPINRIEIILPPILINNIIIMIMISIIGLFYSHRIAGPAYRIEKDITRVLEGEKGVRIHLRKYDKLKSLAGKVNMIIEKLESSDK